MVRRCEICGKEFVAQRSTARYCSARCRKRKERAKEDYAFVGIIKAPVPSEINLTEDEVLAIIQRAHNAAEDLSRAASRTSSPLCLSLARIARKIDAALRREGL